jgi:uncharacterized protein (DUF362 family)
MTDEQMGQMTHPTDRGTSRRQVLRAGVTLGLAGLGAAGYALLYDPKGDRGLPKHQAYRLKDYFAGLYDQAVSESLPRLSIARGQDAATMVAAALQPYGGMSRFIKSGDVVLVKPNVGFASAPSIGATTSPELVEAVVRECLKAGATKVIVADNPIATPETAFLKSGIGPAARRAGAQVLLPSQPDFTNVEIRANKPDRSRGESLGAWPIFWKPIAQATKVIGLPTVKDHNLCSASISMKNWYGLLGGRRDQFHQAIDNIVSDLGLMMSPTLIIADGTRVLMRSGPTGGRKTDLKAANTIVAALDPVACDAWCYQNLLDRDPARLSYLELAEGKFGSSRQLKRFGQRDWRAYKRQGLVKEIHAG